MTAPNIDEILEELPPEKLLSLWKAGKAYEKSLEIAGPQTDDELHAWIKKELGIDIPRTSVCEDHVAPFQFLADLFFERVNAALGMANRGGSKTFIVALLHWLNSRFKAGCESATFGATEAQSLRAYAHLKAWIYDDEGNVRPEIVVSKMRETVWRNNSKVEVLPGTPQAVNGPHPQKAHADEIELMDDETWKESRNMTISKTTVDGRTIPPQDISTSTRKGPAGRMQQLIDEINEAIRDGYDPPRKLYAWCIFETAAERPDCQMVDKNEREARLKELDRDPCELCDCDRIKRGEWPSEDGDQPAPRLLKDVCGGKFFKSRGWQPPQDVKKQFLENDIDTWETQQECKRAEMSNHYLSTFRREKHCLRDYVPHPENGPIFMAVDWGTQNPAAVHWYQYLRRDVIALGWDHKEKTLRAGSVICFDEIYIADIGNIALGERVIKKEKMYEAIFQAEENPTEFEIEDRFPDPQGKGARKDWKEMGLETHFHTTREFEEHIKAIKEFFDFDRFFVHGVKCQMWVREAESWQKDPKTGKQIDKFNHAMSNFRYAMSNIRVWVRKKLKDDAQAPGADPIHRKSATPGHTTAVRSGNDHSGPVSLGGSEFDAWRQSLGAPETIVREG